MSRSLLKSLLATVAVAAFSAGTLSVASAAPVMTALTGANIQASSSTMAQPVYWVWHNHHKHWVSDHHHH